MRATMTDQWQKAREAALDAISAVRDMDYLSPDAYLDAALSAYAEAGYVLVPREPPEKVVDAMINAQIDAEITFDDLTGPMECAYRAMITAALKERT